MKPGVMPSMLRDSLRPVTNEAADSGSRRSTRMPAFFPLRTLDTPITIPAVPEEPQNASSPSVNCSTSSWPISTCPTSASRLLNWSV